MIETALHCMPKDININCIICIEFYYLCVVFDGSCSTIFSRKYYLLDQTKSDLLTSLTGCGIIMYLL